MTFTRFMGLLFVSIAILTHKMFSHSFNNCKEILVTGCQRSGTTIATKIIADILDFTPVDENDYSWNGGWKPTLGNLLKNSKPRSVYQGPAICHDCHKVPNHMAVVFMVRDHDDIRRSMSRVKWRGENKELAKYGCTFKENGRIEKIKESYWRLWQKNKIKNAFEVRYDELRWHPFWVSKRKHFLIKQTA